MQSVFMLCISALILSPSAFAALATDANSALAFYRSKSSAFPSGQASRTNLEKNLSRVELEVSYQASWDKKNFRLRGAQILRDIQVSRLADMRISTPLLRLNSTDSEQIKTLLPKTTVEILETDEFWARIKERNSGIEGWVQLESLQTRHDDLGVFVNYQSTYMRTLPDSFSKPLVQLPRLQRVVPLEITKNFLKIQRNGLVGYVDITHFFSRADFATLTYHPTKAWLPVSFRNNNTLLTPKGEVVSLNQVLGYVTNPKRAFIISPSGNYGPPLRSQVEITKADSNYWGLSQIDGHGDVWWKKTTVFTKENETPDSLTSEELLKKEIYSLAFESKNSVRGILSSEGVYRTEDGLNWTLIPQFGKQNYPVSIHPKGVWFVGPYRSLDKGKSFEPFIRWDHIAEAIEGAYHRNPKILKLTKIEALANSQVQISVDTGSSLVRLRSTVAGANWSVVKTN